MVKRRPVLVIAGAFKGRGNLVTIVGLSTVTPDPLMPFHMALPRASLPQLGEFQGQRDTWVKGDMIYTVGFHRLDLIKLGKRDPRTGRRMYFRDCLSRTRMVDVYGCVLHGMNMGHLADHVQNPQNAKAPERGP